MKTHCPNARAAIEAREQHLQDTDGKDVWAIGDGLLRDLQAPESAGDSTERKLKAFAKELVKDGYKKYGTSTLRDWWNTAASFPRSRRNHDVPFFVYSEAKSPDFLDWIVEDRGTDISGRDVRKLRHRWQVLQRQERRKEIAEAKEAVKQAKTPQAKVKAEEKVEELGSVMPEPSPYKIPRPKGGMVTAMNTMADVMDVGLKAKDTVKDLRRQQATINAMRDRIDVEYIDAIVETYEEGATIIKQIIDGLSKGRLKRFSTISGGKAS